MLRMNHRLRAGGVAWGICLLYVLFLFAPRFELFSHVHEHGDRPHHHGFLSAHDAVLQQTVRALGEAPAPKGSSGAGSASANALLPLEAGVAGVAPQKGIVHSHYQEDPNLLGLGSDPSRIPEARVFPPAVPPAERPAATAHVAATARAPPSPAAAVA